MVSRALTKLSEKDETESESEGIFSKKLLGRVDITDCDKKKSDIDKYVGLLTKDKEPSGETIEVQLKSTRKTGKKSLSCKDKFLNYCRQNRAAVLLVFVNIPDNKVYWQHMDRAFIDHGLKFNPEKQKTKTVYLKDLIEDADNFVEKAIVICKEHGELFAQQENFEQRKKDKKIGAAEKSPIEIVANDRYGEKSGQQLPEALSGEELANAVVLVGAIKIKAQAVVNRLLDKLIEYQAALYLLSPVYLDRRGDMVRKKIRDIINISPEEEAVLLQYALESGFVTRIGDLVNIQDMEAAKACASVVIEDKKIDIDELLKDFE